MMLLTALLEKSREVNNKNERLFCQKFYFDRGLGADLLELKRGWKSMGAIW